MNIASEIQWMTVAYLLDAHERINAPVSGLATLGETLQGRHR
jgi:hypothetical protein